MKQDSYPRKHPFKNLYTHAELAILSWEEAALPESLPQEILQMAVPGSACHPFFEGKEVWFWDAKGLRVLLDYLESIDSKTRCNSHFAIDCILARENKDGEYDFGDVISGLDRMGQLEPYEVSEWLDSLENRYSDMAKLFSVYYYNPDDYNNPTGSSGRMWPEVNWLRITILTIVLGYVFYAMSSCYVANGLRL